MLHHSISDTVSFLQRFYLTDFAAVSVILMCFDSTSCIHFHSNFWLFSFTIRIWTNSYTFNHFCCHSCISSPSWLLFCLFNNTSLCWSVATEGSPKFSVKTASWGEVLPGLCASVLFCLVWSKRFLFLWQHTKAYLILASAGSLVLLPKLPGCFEPLMCQSQKLLVYFAVLIFTAVRLWCWLLMLVAVMQVTSTGAACFDLLVSAGWAGCSFRYQSQGPGAPSRNRSFSSYICTSTCTSTPGKTSNQV